MSPGCLIWVAASQKGARRPAFHSPVVQPNAPLRQVAPDARFAAVDALENVGAVEPFGAGVSVDDFTVWEDFEAVGAADVPPPDDFAGARRLRFATALFPAQRRERSRA